MNEKKAIVLLIIFFSGVVAFEVFYNNYTESKLEKKIEDVARQVELIKIDLESIQVKVPAFKEKIDGVSFNNLLSLQKKFAKMKEQIEILSKKNETAVVTEVREKEERLLREHAKTIKKAWISYLDQKLSGFGFEQDERDIVLADYQRMLDGINEEQFKWYRGDVSSEELAESINGLGKDLFDDMSETVGEQKASVILGVIFPDPMVRKSFFMEK